MDPCLLADTGINQTTTLILSSGVILLTLALLFLTRRSHVKYRLLTATFVFGFSLLATPISFASAQSAEDCAPSSNVDLGETEPQVLSLIDDESVLQLPTVDDTSSRIYISLLSNDLPPVNDPINWSTLDIDPVLAGRQTQLLLNHPDTPNGYSCVIGEINVLDYGVLDVALRYECEYEDEDFIFQNLTIPTDYLIPPFDYIVKTTSGLNPTEPATVNIYVEDNIVPSEVFAVSDEMPNGTWSGCFESSTMDIIANDSTSVGVLDPASIDLDLSRQGLQKTLTINGITFTLGNDGILSMDNTLEDARSNELNFSLYYVINNEGGSISNVARIYITCHNGIT